MSWKSRASKDADKILFHKTNDINDTLIKLDASSTLFWGAPQTSIVYSTLFKKV